MWLHFDDRHLKDASQRWQYNNLDECRFRCCFNNWFDLNDFEQQGQGKLSLDFEKCENALSTEDVRSIGSIVPSEKEKWKCKKWVQINIKRKDIRMLYLCMYFFF